MHDGCVTNPIQFNGFTWNYNYAILRTVLIPTRLLVGLSIMIYELLSCLLSIIVTSLFLLTFNLFLIYL